MVVDQSRTRSFKRSFYFFILHPHRAFDTQTPLTPQRMSQWRVRLSPATPANPRGKLSHNLFILTFCPPHGGWYGALFAELEKYSLLFAIPGIKKVFRVAREDRLQSNKSVIGCFSRCVLGWCYDSWRRTISRSVVQFAEGWLSSATCSHFILFEAGLCLRSCRPFQLRRGTFEAAEIGSRMTVFGINDIVAVIEDIHLNQWLCWIEEIEPPVRSPSTASILQDSSAQLQARVFPFTTSLKE